MIYFQAAAAKCHAEDEDDALIELEKATYSHNSATEVTHLMGKGQQRKKKQLTLPWLSTEGDMAVSKGDVFNPELEARFSALNIITACFMAFSHGANDIANAAGPMVAIWDTYQKGTVDQQVQVYYWIVVLCCVGTQSTL